MNSIIVIDDEKTLETFSLNQINKIILSNALAIRRHYKSNKVSNQLNLSFRPTRYRIQKHKLKNKRKESE